MTAMALNVPICGQIAVISFLSSVTSLLIISIVQISNSFNVSIRDLFIAHAVINHVILWQRYWSQSRPKLHFQVSLRAALLGEAFALGVLIWLLGTDWSASLGLYVVVMSLFHFSEYMTTAIINPRSLSLDSFLLNHSKEYGMAAMAAMIEFFVEVYFWPQIKSYRFVTALGLVFTVFGELLRKSAMITSGTNFNHIVQSRRQEGHELVTHGIYGLCRHPSYVGWFCWSIGTQLILTNPLCCVVYVSIIWKFFKERIYEEEVFLLKFFGEEYVEYKRRVPTGIPFISGYRFQR